MISTGEERNLGRHTPLKWRNAWKHGSSGKSVQCNRALLKTGAHNRAASIDWTTFRAICDFYVSAVLTNLPNLPILRSDPHYHTDVWPKWNTLKHLNIWQQCQYIPHLPNKQHNILIGLCFFKIFKLTRKLALILKPPLTTRLWTVFDANLSSAVFLDGRSSFFSERAGSAEKHRGGDIKGDSNYSDVSHSSRAQ